MHYCQVRLGAFHSVDGEPEEMRILPDRRERIASHSLELDSQHVDDIEFFEDGVETVGYSHGKPADLGRHERRWADEYDFGAEFGHCPDIASGDARMGDIADYSYLEPFQASFDLAYCVDVKQRLGGVLVVAVAGVYDTGVNMPTQKFRGASGIVANNDDINP